MVPRTFTFLHPASDEDVSRGTGSRQDTPLLTLHNSCIHLFLLGLQVLAVPSSMCHHQFAISYGSPALAVQPLPSKAERWVRSPWEDTLSWCDMSLEAQRVRLHTSPISTALHMALKLLFHFLTCFVHCAEGFFPAVEIRAVVFPMPFSTFCTGKAKFLPSCTGKAK